MLSRRSLHFSLWCLVFLSPACGEVIEIEPLDKDIRDVGDDSLDAFEQVRDVLEADVMAPDPMSEDILGEHEDLPPDAPLEDVLNTDAGVQEDVSVEDDVGEPEDVDVQDDVGVQDDIDEGAPDVVEDVEAPVCPEEHILEEPWGCVWVVNGCPMRPETVCRDMAFEGVDLSGLDLNLSDFSGSSFSDVDISETDFQLSTLAGVDFFATNAQGANFQGADLRAITIEAREDDRSVFSHADFGFAILDGARFSQDWNHTSFVGASFVGASMKDIAFTDGLNYGDVSLSRADLSGADLSGSRLYAIQMDGAIFHGAVLDEVRICNFNGVPSSADFTDASFIDAWLGPCRFTSNFTRADLSGARLEGPDLRGSTFVGARFDGADIDRSTLSEFETQATNMDEVDLSGATMIGTVLKAVSMRGATFEGSDLGDSAFNAEYDVILGRTFRPDLTGADLSGVSLVGASIRGAIFTDANLSGVDFSDTALLGTSTQTDACVVTVGYLDLSGVQLTGAQFQDTRIWAVDFTGADLSSAVFSGAHFETLVVDDGCENEIVVGSRLRGADLSGTSLECALIDDAAVFDEVIWSATTCPDGTSSDEHPGEHCLEHLDRDELVCRP